MYILYSGILSGKKCYVGVGGMHTISRYEAKSAVKHGAVLKSGVRVSKILPYVQNVLDVKNVVGSQPDSYSHSHSDMITANEKMEIDNNITNRNTDTNIGTGTVAGEEKVAGNVIEECSSKKNKKWELFGTGGVAALHDSAESVASGVNHYSLGIFDAVIVTGKNILHFRLFDLRTFITSM